jgi:hypothetical protein
MRQTVAFTQSRAFEERDCVSASPRHDGCKVTQDDIDGAHGAGLVVGIPDSVLQAVEVEA